MYEQSLKYHCQRYSNNSKPLFSDEEILTIYFFVGHEQKYTLIKDIHNFAKEYLRDWFPNLVSYQTFNYRLNRMAGAVRELSSQLLRMFRPSDCQDDTVIVDSMPIITCCGRNRTGKVARDIASFLLPVVNILSAKIFLLKRSGMHSLWKTFRSFSEAGESAIWHG